MDQSANDNLTKATQALQDQINDLKNKQQVVVTQTPTDMRNVYYATQPVDAGAKISPAFFEKKLTPNDVLPDAYTDQSDIVGFYAIRPIEKGDPLTPRNIGKTLPFLSERIPPGMRALSLPIFNADDNNTGGFIVDGDKVDLLFTHFMADNTTLDRTSLVMQSVNVLYVPGPTTRDNTTAGIVPIPAPGEPLAVTFEVTPEQAQALTYMTNIKNGRFSMILRARRDVSEIRIKPFATEDYEGDYHSVQKRVVDKSVERVAELQAQIEEQEKKDQAAQGTTNETPHPTPPSQ